MKVNGKTVLLCSCDDTMPLDPKALAAALGTTPALPVRQLCGGDLGAFRAAFGEGELLVCCTQEAPLLAEVADGAGQAVRFADIRDRAGWSDEAARATPKIAALIAEAGLDAPAVPALTLNSQGSVVVYGHDEAALDAARRLTLRGHAVTCVLGRPDALLPPARRDFVLGRGILRRAEGHVGAFVVTVEGFAPAQASSRGVLGFDAPGGERRIDCDLILDLSGDTPLFPASARRDGYVRAAPGSPVAIERALLEVTDLVGEFERPRHVTVDAALCAHSRNQITACTRCIDACPGGSIRPGEGSVQVTAETCFGHGSCTTACPTGAIRFQGLGGTDPVLQRLRTLLQTYRGAGGEQPVVLVHDARHGDELLRLMARLGPGLPARVLPLAVTELGVAGLALMLSALAYGAAGVVLLAAPEDQAALAATEAAVAQAEAVAAGLGYGAGRIALSTETDALALAAALRRPVDALPGAAAEFLPGSRKRDTLGLALSHLHRHAPRPVDSVPLPAGSPFGAVLLQADKCTLCMSCTTVCPTGALSSNAERPQLGFTQTNCVQCGLCRATCPEKAITLEPLVDFTEAARRRRVLKEEEPFCCVACGKPFGIRASIEKMIEKLAGHSMFQDPGRLDLLRMCEDCRVVSQFDQGATGRRPVPRTTEDYLREREPPVRH